MYDAGVAGRDPGPRVEWSEGGETAGNAPAIRDVVRSITSEFEVVMGRSERVEECCRRLRQLIHRPPTRAELRHLSALPRLLLSRGGAIAVPLFDLLASTAGFCSEPWPFLRGLLAARDSELAHRALDLTASLSESGALTVDERVAGFFAEQVAAKASPLGEEPSLRQIAGILRRLPVAVAGARECGPARPFMEDPHGAGPPDPILALYRHSRHGSLRRLAARLLDLDGRPVADQLAAEFLGSSTHSFLRPYLEYTRASHLDLLHLAATPGVPPPALPSLAQVEAAVGPSLLREVIAALGWHRVNLGLQVRAYVGVSLARSIPLPVTPAEALVIEAATGARRVSEAFLFVAHGGLPTRDIQEGAPKNAVGRFRAYNLAHAEVLTEIMDIAPLTREKVHRILQRMDGIVSEFVALFGACSGECTILPDVYAELRRRVTGELEKEIAGDQLSPELTRLVQMFDDPASLGAVRTLHGLKRYLHQRGLELGLRLVESGLATNRTVSLVAATPRRLLRTFTRIDYTDFEADDGVGDGAAQGSDAGGGDRGLHPGLAVVIEGCGRQLLDGQESFPSIKVFCFGNEVHYYIAFRNHPAFLRIDYSPPLKGGMVDLEYYGVSKYELSVHPNPALDAIRLFFRHLDFDVRIEGTRVHARYDKERAVDLGDLRARAEAVGRLIPFLMDVDWIIGGLDLDGEGRRKVAAAWADRFARSGGLPIGQILTRDRRGILAAVESGAGGEREVVWRGEGPYRDRFPLFSGEEVARLGATVEALGIEAAATPATGDQDASALLPLDQHLLRPLRAAIARGEIELGPDGLRRCAPERFRPRHEAEVLAEILAADDDVLLPAARLARLAALLERSLRFRTTGSVNAYEVQRARLPLPAEDLGLYVLRDAGGIIRLALFSHGESIAERRDDPRDPWRSNASMDVTELALHLRRANYLTPGMEPPSADESGESLGIRAIFRRTSPITSSPPLPGERLVAGLRAAPGRAVGMVRFGTAGRTPGDFHDAVLVSPAVRPEDMMLLQHAAAIVSTGGGILSHAGLIAIQLQKPALIISGQWREEPDGARALLHHTLEYREERREIAGCRVALRHDLRERQHRLEEGDLVVVDAQAGILRVLGHDRDALALHDELRQLAAASAELARSTDEAEILLWRGRLLRARYQLGKLLSRLRDPVLARHAVQELLLGGGGDAGDAVSRGHRPQLLAILLDHPSLGAAARQGLLEIGEELLRRGRAAAEKATHAIPISTSTFEILSLRLSMLRLRRTLEGVASVLTGCGMEALPLRDLDPDAIDRLAARRLAELRAEWMRALGPPGPESRRHPPLRHSLREIGRLDLLLGTPDRERELVLCREGDLVRSDETARRRLAGRHVLGPEDGGFELHPLVGWKAANLAEVARWSPERVPPWFAVSERAFHEVLDSPAGAVDPATGGGARASTLRQAIAALVARSDLGPVQKSTQIRRLWDDVVLPRELSAEVLAAYHRLVDEAPGEPPIRMGAGGDFVAVRSSSREEDAETAARAGEFDTFLFVRGEDQLLGTLKRAWSGLWTERAIHRRSVLGLDSAPSGGGVIVQRMVDSRVSGVLQTVSIAAGELREMVINAGLGLGEGVVSGTVAADLVVVAKENGGGQGALRFRYMTSDKRRQVVFDRQAGFGTVLAETLAHQRLRPALEYVELRELVAAAAELEAHYGYPLDIEFAIEGTRLWILQVRPLAVYLPVLRETLEEHPICISTRLTGTGFHEESR